MEPLNIRETSADELYPAKLWVRGGFPESYLAAIDEDSYAYRRNFIHTYLEMDVPQFGPRIPAETLGRLWIMLAAIRGNLN